MPLWWADQLLLSGPTAHFSWCWYESLLLKLTEKQLLVLTMGYQNCQMIRYQTTGILVCFVYISVLRHKAYVWHTYVLYHDSRNISHPQAELCNSHLISSTLLNLQKDVSYSRVYKWCNPMPRHLMLQLSHGYSMCPPSLGLGTLE